MSITRITRPGTESLQIAPCPCCGGSVQVSDCGYSAFNPGSAKCNGECKREWSLGYVDDQWDCGKRWNERAPKIRRKLLVLSMFRVNKRLSISRDFAAEELEQEAAVLLAEMEEIIIGADKKREAAQ